MVLLNSPNTAFITAAPIGGGKVALRKGIHKALGANAQGVIVSEKKTSEDKDKEIQEILIRELLLNPPELLIPEPKLRILLKAEAETGEYVRDEFVISLLNYRFNQLHNGIIIIESLRTPAQVIAATNRLKIMGYTIVAIFRDAPMEACIKTLGELKDEKTPDFQIKAAFHLWEKNAADLNQAMQKNAHAFINFSDMPQADLSSDTLKEMIETCLIEKECATAVVKGI